MRRPCTTTSGWRREADNERGASLVEFALVVPLFIMLLFGLVDFGLVFAGYTALRSDVGAGTRSVAVGNIPSSCNGSPNLFDCTVCSYITSLPAIDTSTIVVTTTFPDGAPAQQGQTVDVTATAKLVSVTGFNQFLGVGHVTVTSEYRIEQPPAQTAEGSLACTPA